MTDIEIELKNLNDNATLLLTKYDGVFSKLSEESQKILLSMETQGKAVLDDISKMLASGNVAQAENALRLEGKNFDEIIDEIIPVGTILEFMLIENGKKINFANDPIDKRASSQGFELFCPHSKEEYEKARQYLLSIGKPTAMGPLGIYYPYNGQDFSNYALNSNELGSKGWKVQDGSLTWWAADTTSDSTFDRKPMAEPNGNYTAKAYLGITYDDNGYIKHYDDDNSSYSYTTYLCVRRKR